MLEVRGLGDSGFAVEADTGIGTILAEDGAGLGGDGAPGDNGL